MNPCKHNQDSKVARINFMKSAIHASNFVQTLTIYKLLFILQTKKRLKQLVKSEANKVKIRDIRIDASFTTYNRLLSESIRGCDPWLEGRKEDPLCEILDDAKSTEKVISKHNFPCPARLHTALPTCSTTPAHPQATTYWPCIRPCFL